MSDFTFKKGTFVQLKANSTIHLGRLERNIYAGDIVEFDGSALKFNGSTTEMPELKAGLKRGWLSLIDEEEDIQKAQEPTPAPAPAKKKMPVQTVYDEERPVSEIKTSKKKIAKKFPLIVESQDDDMRAVAKVKNSSGAEISGATSSGDGLSEIQEGKTVSTIKLKTSSKQKTVISDGLQASEEISKLDNIQVPVTKTAKAKKKVDEQSLENAQILQAIDGEVQPEQGAVVIGKDKSKIKLLPGGVEWDTSKHWSKRAKIALEMYKGDQETLNAIIEIETKGVISAIKKGLQK